MPRKKGPAVGLRDRSSGGVRDEALEHPVAVRMPPKRRTMVLLKVGRISKALPHIVEPDDH